jgi:hypothetical protein
MTGTNGAVATSDGDAPDAALPDDAIDGALQAVESEVVDTRAIRAEQEAAELKQQLRAQQDMIGELRKSTTAQSEMLSELVGRTREAEDRGWDVARHNILGRMEDAVNQADTQAFRVARQDLDALDHHQQARKQQKKPKDDPPAASQQQSGQVDAGTQAAFRSWVAENPWFNADNKLRVQAVAVDAILMADEPHLSPADRYKKVRDEIVRLHPDKFTTQARQQPPAVSRPSAQAAVKAKPKTKTLADLDDDARAAFKQLKRMNPEYTEAMYLKDYRD